MSILRSIQIRVAKSISLKLIPKTFSIISDDCWGGQIYRQLNLHYLTPTVGLWIKSSDYLDFLENFNEVNDEDLVFIKGERDYPVALLSNIEIHFMHYVDEYEATKKYWRRYSRINRNQLLFKIDFGKPGYSKKDIERWNSMRLKNSIAFYPPSIKIPNEGVYNGVEVEDWTLNGGEMFNITRKHFNLFAWLRGGVVKSGTLYQLMNALLFDPTASKKQIANKVLESIGYRR